MEKIIIVFLTCLVTLNIAEVKAQLLKGKVFDATNREALPSAVIYNLSDSIGTTADETGMFSININNFPVTLQISYVGYEELTITINSYRNFLNIGLNASEHHLNEVVVQATRFNQKLMEIPAAVHAITEAEINRNDETVIMPVINRVPGVLMESGNLNTNRLSIRGIGSRTPYGTNRVRAYFNDIPLTSGEGESTLEDIDLNALERVEIIKGPTSSVYGAGLGGTVNLIAKSPRYMDSYARLKFVGGSFGLRNIQASMAYAFNEGSVVVNVNDLHSDGFRENSAYDRQSVTISSTILNEEGLSMSFLGSFIDLKSYIPSSIDQTTLEESPRSAASNWAEAQGYEAYIKSFAGFSFDYDVADQLSHHTSVFVSFRDADEPRPFDILKENTVATGVRSRIEFNNKTGIRAQLGAEVFSDWYSWSTYENLYELYPDQGSIAGSILSNNKEKRSYYNLFLQLRWELNDKLNIEGGLNYNNTTYAITDLYTDDNMDQTGDYSYDPVFSPRVGLVYKLPDDWNVYLSASHGFSMPSLEETLTPEGQINTNIEPETGMNYELGTKGNWFKDRMYGELSFYYMDIKNLLVAERVGPDQYIGVNAGRAIHKGIELFLDYQIFKNQAWTVNPNLSLTLTDYKFDEFIHRETDYSGREISGFPSSIMNIGLDINSTAGLYLFADYRYVGKAPLNDLNTLYNQDYSIVNLKAGYSHEIENFTIEVSGGVNNLLDTSYASMILVNAVGFGSAEPRYFYPGMPINYFAGLNIKFNF